MEEAAATCGPKVAPAAEGAASSASSKAAPTTLEFGSRAAAHEGLPGDLKAARNRFFSGERAGKFGATEFDQGGYHLQVFLPANSPACGEVYVREIDQAGPYASTRIR